MHTSKCQILTWAVLSDRHSKGKEDQSYLRSGTRWGWSRLVRSWHHRSFGRRDKDWEKRCRCRTLLSTKQWRIMARAGGVGGLADPADLTMTGAVKVTAWQTLAVALRVASLSLQRTKCGGIGNGGGVGVGAMARFSLCLPLVQAHKRNKVLGRIRCRFGSFTNSGRTEKISMTRDVLLKKP